MFTGSRAKPGSYFCSRSTTALSTPVASTVRLHRAYSSGDRVTWITRSTTSGYGVPTATRCRYRSRSDTSSYSPCSVRNPHPQNTKSSQSPCLSAFIGVRRRLNFLYGITSGFTSSVIARSTSSRANTPLSASSNSHRYSSLPHWRAHQPQCPAAHRQHRPDRQVQIVAYPRRFIHQQQRDRREPANRRFSPGQPHNPRPVRQAQRYFVLSVALWPDSQLPGESIRFS